MCHPEKEAHAFGLCLNCYMVEYRQKFPERSKDSWYRAVYGISFYRYRQLWERQNGKCAICKEPVKLHIDYDHITDEVRGLLCTRCNPGLGFFGNDPERLQAAAEYLETWSNA